jgi:hypothetical protein
MPAEDPYTAIMLAGEIPIRVPVPLFRPLLHSSKQCASVSILPLSDRAPVVSTSAYLIALELALILISYVLVSLCMPV